MGHSYGSPTIKALFAQATHCAYPDCNELLVFEEPSRGVRTIAVQIAHIRSEKPDGPRYDARYSDNLLNMDENLLLLCGKHHTAVDQNDSVFTTDELVEWKHAQVSQSGGTTISDSDIANLVRTLESTLSALYEALSVSVSVQIVGGRPTGDGIVAMPFEALSMVRLPNDNDPIELFGVKVVNQGSTGIDVASAGMEFDIGLAYERPSWIFGGSWCRQNFPYRLNGRSTEYWYVQTDSVSATVCEIAKKYEQVPMRIRPFADLGNETREFGRWTDAIRLPIWKDGIHQNLLRTLGQR